MSKYRQMADQIRDMARYEPIKILVWGPGDPGPNASPQQQKAYGKRVQIKNVLKDKFPNAEVYFSEDQEMIELSNGISGQLRKEALQAKISDLVLMLDINRGADLELDHFIPTYPWFAQKVHVLLPEKYVNTKGLVREILNYLQPHQIDGFSDREFKECTVATVKAVRPALGVALDRRLQSL